LEGTSIRQRWLEGRVFDIPLVAGYPKKKKKKKKKNSAKIR
jgi:hypothetical protein